MDNVKKIFSERSDARECIGNDFLRLIAAWDNDEEWAKERLAEYWKNPVPDLADRIDQARLVVHEHGAWQGNPRDMLFYGITVTDFNTKMTMLLPLAEQGNIDAILSIAREFSLGECSQCGTPVNEKEAFKWYLKAANLGDASAQLQVALEYETKQNYAEAFEWYTRAAKQQSAPGYCGMARYYEAMYMNADNLDKNELLNKKIECYETAYRYVNSEEEESQVAFGMAGTYRQMSYYGNETEAIWFAKLAIFYYWAAYDCGHKGALKFAKEIAAERNIYVDFDNMTRWAQAEGILS